MFQHKGGWSEKKNPPNRLEISVSSSKVSLLFVPYYFFSSQTQNKHQQTKGSTKKGRRAWGEIEYKWEKPQWNQAGWVSRFHSQKFWNNQFHFPAFFPSSSSFPFHASAPFSLFVGFISSTWWQQVYPVSAPGDPTSECRLEDVTSRNWSRHHSFSPSFFKAGSRFPFALPLIRSLYQFHDECRLNMGKERKKVLCPPSQCGVSIYNN